MATGLISLSMFAQSAIQTTPHNKADMMAKFKNATAVPYNPMVKDNGTGIPYNAETFYAKAGSRTGETIGSTGYPLQSNSAAEDRVIAYPDGSVSAIWTGSTVADGAWGDRGMFYNHSDGTSWGPAPTARVETPRSGFGTLVKVGDHEIVMSHDGATIGAYENSAPGATDWTALGISGQMTGLWPRVYCPEGTETIYAICANAGAPTAMNFSRSDDGGATYAIVNQALPIGTDMGVGAISADCYQIGVFGSTVYVLYGSSWTNLYLLTSTENGEEGTWTVDVIINTGFDNFQGDLDQISDVDGDGIADTVETTDGFHEMIVDDLGIVHVWSGYYLLLDDDPAEGWNYFPGVGGMWYWNSTMAFGEPGYIDLIIDWDGSGDYTDGIGADLGMYDGVTFTSMPAAAVDYDLGRIYLTYVMPIEYTDYFDDPTVAEAQSFRDLFGTYSDDGGMTWSAPINMTYTAHENQETAFPYAYDRVVGDCMHTIWMQDEEPGTSLDNGQVAADADAIGNIQYRCFDEARFNPYPPTAEYDYTPSGALVNFNNLSVDADEYSWDFGDAATSTAKNPAHVYAVSGTYNVCLTATNHYDSDNACKIININVGVINYALNAALTVYPTPASTNVTIDVDGSFGTLYAEMYNTLGEKVINTTAFTGNVNFNLAAIAAGNYVVKVYSADGLYTSRQITVSK
jgi:PKD repeat protein